MYFIFRTGAKTPVNSLIKLNRCQAVGFRFIDRTSTGISVQISRQCHKAINSCDIKLCIIVINRGRMKALPFVYSCRAVYQHS